MRQKKANRLFLFLRFGATPVPLNLECHYNTSSRDGDQDSVCRSKKKETATDLKLALKVKKEPSIDGAGLWLGTALSISAHDRQKSSVRLTFRRCPDDANCSRQQPALVPPSVVLRIGPHNTTDRAQLASHIYEPCYGNSYATLQRQSRLWTGNPGLGMRRGATARPIGYRNMRLVAALRFANTKQLKARGVSFIVDGSSTLARPV